jgi:hypothetical protein
MSTPDILYHYCSTEAFHSIISGRSLRLSGLSFSNDYLEGKLARQLIGDLCDQSGFDAYQKKRVEDLLTLIDQYFDGHGFCLSEDGDVLSQWRGYANNGNGISIGFSTKYLEKIVDTKFDQISSLLSLSKVLYRKEEHMQIIQPIFDKVHRVVNDPDFRDMTLGGLLSIASSDYLNQKKKKTEAKGQELVSVISKLMPKMFILKSNAFAEEVEWRLIQSGVSRGDDHSDYMPALTTLIPYQSIDLDVIEGFPPITKIFLGPKHTTPIPIVKAFLIKHGFGNVPICTSVASYR